MTCRICEGRSDAFMCRGCWNSRDNKGLEVALNDLPGLINDVATRAVGEARVYRTSKRATTEPDEELEGLEEEYMWRRQRIPPHLRERTERITLPTTRTAVDTAAGELLTEACNALTTWVRHLAETRGIEISLGVGDGLEGPVCAAHQHDYRVVGCGHHPEHCKQLHPNHVHDMRPRGCGLDVDPDTGQTRCRKLHCDHDSCRTIRHGQLTGVAAATVRWLLNARESIRHDEAAEQIHHEIITLRDKLARAVDRSPEAFAAGPCTDCGTELYRRPGSDTIECDGGPSSGQSGCGKTYTLDERTDWLLVKLEDALVSLDDLRAFVTTTLHSPWPPLATVRSWRMRGRLEVRSVDRLGAELFRGGDVLDLLLDWLGKQDRRARTA